MDIVLSIREFCLGLPEVTEDQAFGEEWVLYRVRGKIFAAVDLTRYGVLTLKCNPDYALYLRDRFPDVIEGAWHWNKKYWNQMDATRVDRPMILHLISHSYNEVLLKLPKRMKTGLSMLEEGESPEFL